MGGVALDRLDQIGDQVGPALILVLDLAPGGFGMFLPGRDLVHAAAGKVKTSRQAVQNARSRLVVLMP